MSEKTTHFIKNVPQQEMDGYYALFEKRANRSSVQQVKYLTFGNIVIKIENHIEHFVAPIETQLAYCISNTAEAYDYRFVIWKDDVNFLLADSVQVAAKLWFSLKNSDNSDIKIDLEENRVEAYNPNTRTYYLSWNTDPDDFVPKMGHLFVRQLYGVVATDEQRWVHAAAVGISDCGVLLCARGGGGKSTLAVSAMLNGFQYVADDYVILSKTEGGQLYAHSIYSTINLTPQMQNKMEGLKAKYMNNSYWQPHKQTLDIREHHDRFVKKLPIKAVVFPRINDFYPAAEHRFAILSYCQFLRLNLDNMNV
jgi:hypothetical protein